MDGIPFGEVCRRPSSWEAILKKQLLGQPCSAAEEPFSAAEEPCFAAEGPCFSAEERLR